MEFPKNYFYDEVREGFYINGMIKREWAAQLETLREIDKVCRKYGIQWFADCGTLIGAVRHGGYIPWDDDLDICMLRDDYDRFLKYAAKDLPDTYVTRTYEDEDYWQMIARVINRDAISYDEDEMEKYHQFPYVAGVDIFVLDYLAPNEGEEETRRQLVKQVLAVGNIKGLESDDPPEEGMKLVRMVEESCNVKFDTKNHLRRQLYQLAEKLSRLYPAEGAKAVVLMPNWCAHHDHKYPIEYVNKITQLPFESMMINVPAGYDAVLNIEYGDYLKIVRNGGIHEYPLYEKQEVFFTKKLEDGNPFRYKFDINDLKRDKEECPKRLKQRAEEYCTVLWKMHDVIRQIVNDQRETVIELLEQCQDGIIQIGNQIEEQEGEGFISVSHIEDYCERIYELSVALEEEDADGCLECADNLDQALDAMEKSFIHDMPERKEIVFLTFRSDLWWAMDVMYRKEAADPLNIVRVIAVPFFERKAGAELGEEHYDLTGYPDDIRITDYREYDIRQRHPDVIYTQNAYDRINYTYVLPPEYFTSELKKYTEELIYIPYFRIGKFAWDDNKLMKTTDDFVRIPGVVHADKVILESEQMRELYIKVLTEFCGDETASVWEQKIITISEDIQAGKIKAEKEVPVEWQGIINGKDGQKKKTVLFMNAMCSLYRYKESALDKLEQVLDCFYENRDSVALIWRPYILSNKDRALFDITFLQRYQKMIDDYRAAGWGAIDESKDAATAIGLADAYYGDPDMVMQRCRNLNMPIMIQNVENI